MPSLTECEFPMVKFNNELLTLLTRSNLVADHTVVSLALEFRLDRCKRPGAIKDQPWIYWLETMSI
jgi:hypothetical protein